MQAGDTTDELLWAVVAIFIFSVILGCFFYWPIMKMPYDVRGDHRVHYVTLFTYFFSRDYAHDTDANAGLDFIYDVYQLHFEK